MKFTIPQKGDYLIGVSAENNARSIYDFDSDITVNIQPHVGSSMLFVIAGIFAFIGGVIVGYINNMQAINEILAEIDWSEGS